MKKICFAFVCLVITATGFAQNSAANATDKLTLTAGQKIMVESTADVQASLSVGGDLVSNSKTTNALEVKNTAGDNITISNTLTKAKVTMNMMGQATNYDSETKSGNNEQMAELFDARLNKAVDVSIYSKNGKPVTDSKKQKKPDSEEANLGSDLLKIFSENATDEGVASGAFMMVPKGKNVGDTWADTTGTGKNTRTISTYTLKSVTGNEATIQANVVSNAVNKLSFQGMEFEIKTETKSTGEIVTDLLTGIVKKRTGTSDITGSIPMMGQEMPINAKSATTIIYR